MSRRNARELVLHMLFDNEVTGNTPENILKQRLEPEYFSSLGIEDSLYESTPDSAQNEYIFNTLTGVILHCEELDNYIKNYSSGWDITRISKISKCILRLSMFEMKYIGIPVGASVNEALELAKKYDGEEVSAFINGILASFIKKEI